MSDRYEGGILSGTAPTVTLQSANGVYTLSQELQYQGQGVWPAAAQTPILKSLRFRSSASANLTRTPSSTGSRTTFTWSGWLKRGTLGVRQSVFSSGASNSNALDIYFTSSDTLTFEEYDGTNYYNRTSAVYRDPSAWYHIVVAVDSTQATSSNRVKMYVNGSQITAFSTALYPTQNFAYQINTSSYPARISNGTLYASEYFDGYQAEINFIDGLQLTPSSFGTTDVNGIWQPIPYAGTYGTNGFYLKFTDTTSTSTLGTDSSGNGNTWTVNNISLTAGSTYDSMLDSPSNASPTIANYAVMNPLWNGYGSPTFSNGNLQTVTSTIQTAIGSMSLPNSAKTYFEATVTSETIAGGTRVGIRLATDNTQYGGWVAVGLGAIRFNDANQQTSLATFTTGDVIGIAVDLTANTLQFYKNNSAFGTSNTITNSSLWVAQVQDNSGAGNTCTISWNFGQQPFVYTPPTGFNRLNTYNLPVPTIPAGNKVMDAQLYTGNGSTNTITNSSGLKSDLVWLKGRSDALFHGLYDTVRGAGSTKGLYSNDTAAEGAYSTYQNFVSFDSSGFTLGSTSATNNINLNAGTFVAWQWQAGQGVTSSNTNGSITSTVSVNTTAGFSIVTYTGSGAAGTVGHGLGVAPAMIITKKRTNAGGGSAATNWVAWHKSLTGAYSSTTGYIYFNATSAGATTTNFYDGTAMTSSTFRWQTGNDNINYSNDTFVSYCWSEIAGFSAFGSYTGNGSADGPFVYTGFRPKYVLIKGTSASRGWEVMDSSRDTYNAVIKTLQPDLSDAEYSNSAYSIDFLSNGFKLRNTNTYWNGSGETYIYMAFAENPFKMARAR